MKKNKLKEKNKPKMYKLFLIQNFNSKIIFIYKATNFR